MLNCSTGTGPDTCADSIMDALTRLLNKAAAIEREPVDTGDGVLLHPSEVHLIDLAARFPQESMSALASRLGITKGAVSQTAKKLEEKGFLERVNGKGDNRTFFLRLTNAGIRAYGWHRAYHAVVNAKIAGHIAGIEKRDREKFLQILCQIEDIFDDCPAIQRRISADWRDNGS